MREKRLGLVRIPWDLLSQILRGEAIGFFPQDSEIINVFTKPEEDVLYVMVWNSSLPVVREGDVIPCYSIIVRSCYFDVPGEENNGLLRPCVEDPLPRCPEQQVTKTER